MVEGLIKSNIIPTNEEARLLWLENFENKLPLYCTILGVSNGDRDLVIEYFKAYSYAVKGTIYNEKYKKSSVAFKALMLKEGKIPNPHPGQFPQYVSLLTPPPEVPNGMIKFLEGVIEICITSPAITDEIAEALWLVPANPAINWDLIPLVLYNQIGTAGVQQIGFKLKGANGIAMYVDRSDKLGWVFMYYVSTSPFTDTTTYPPGTNTNYKYRGIRYIGSGRNLVLVGQYSNEIIMPVSG